MQEVLRRQGFGGNPKVRPEIKSLTEDLFASIESHNFLEPMVAYESYSITGMDGSQISLVGDRAVHGPALPALFPEAKELVALVCTIGPKLEKHVSDYNKSGQALRSLLLDGIGSAAVDAMIPAALSFIGVEVSSRGYETSTPVNPGMPGFPMTEQRNLLELTQADKIGVSLTSSGILIPRKSVSMVIGIGPEMPMWTQAEVCARCNLRESCPYRVRG